MNLRNLVVVIGMAMAVICGCTTVPPADSGATAVPKPDTPPKMSASEKRKQIQMEEYKRIDSLEALRQSRADYKGGKESPQWRREMRDWLKTQDAYKLWGGFEFKDSSNYLHVAVVGLAYCPSGHPVTSMRMYQMKAEMMARKYLAVALGEAKIVKESGAIQAHDGQGGESKSEYRSVSISGSQKGYVEISHGTVTDEDGDKYAYSVMTVDNRIRAMNK